MLIRLSNPATLIRTMNTVKLVSNDFVRQFQEDRIKAGTSVIDFPFEKRRMRILNDVKVVSEGKAGILYWMSRDQRVQDNWAFLFAQKLAMKNHLPLHVAFCLVPRFLDATIRQFSFMLGGLEEVERDCRALDINFHLLLGQASEQIPRFVKEENIGAVVCDFSPLRVPRAWVDGVKEKIPLDVPLCQVDAHNIVPLWVTSDKLEYAAYTIRNKVNSNLPTFLTAFPPLIRHPFPPKSPSKPVDWQKAFDMLEVDRTVEEVKWARPGYTAAVAQFQTFVEKRLKDYAMHRNNPTVEAQSGLAPWVHFGQISIQRVMRVVQPLKASHKESVEMFMEQGIVRRELADNFCYYNPNYDSIEGLDAWAKKTLDDHRKDKRPYIYSQQEFDDAKTHDPLWNAAQIQLRREGKLHGFLRMYWAKKILEWCPSPEEALRIAIYFNDRYNLDGRDPNGYTGCMWSIGGIHDRPFGERNIFGKIRIMTFEGSKKKFDVHSFCNRFKAIK